MAKSGGPGMLATFDLTSVGWRPDGLSLTNVDHGFLNPVSSDLEVL